MVLRFYGFTEVCGGWLSLPHYHTTQQPYDREKKNPHFILSLYSCGVKPTFLRNSRIKYEWSLKPNV